MPVFSPESTASFSADIKHHVDKVINGTEVLSRDHRGSCISALSIDHSFNYAALFSLLRGQDLVLDFFFSSIVS